MYQKVTISLLLSIALQSQIFAFKPKLSIIGSYTATRNFMEVTSGEFEIKNRGLNFGLEGTNKFLLTESIFLSAGLRYNQYKTVIEAVNQMPLLNDNPGPFSWVRKYESLAIPLAIGRDFTTRKGKKGDYYVGCSMGALMTSEATNNWYYPGKKDPDNTDLIYTVTRDSANQVPAYFFPTFDFGVNYCPFNTPKLSVGFLASLQLNKTDPYTYTGTVANLTQGEVYNYECRHHQQFFNFSFLLSYNFGKAKPKNTKPNSKIDCPK